MPQIRWYDDPTIAAPLSVGDDGDSWWSAAQRCFVGVAIAATMAVSAAQTLACSNQLLYNEDQVPAGKLSGQPDEDFWQNPTAPLALKIWQNWAALPYLPDPEEIPANKLRGQPDEDWYQAWGLSLPPPFLAPQPFAFDPGEWVTPPIVIGTDEDFWQNPVSPQPIRIAPLYLPDPEFLPAGNLFGQADEDLFQFGQSPPTVFNDPQPFSWDAGEFPVFPTDEDFLQPLGVSPPPPFLAPQPFSFDPGEFPVFPTDEDFWVNPVAPAGTAFFKMLLADDGALPPTAILQPDEDFLPPSQLSPCQAFGPLYIPDPEEIPAHTLYHLIDEDYWQCPVAPVSPSFFRPYGFGLDPDEVPAGYLLSAVEDFPWQNQVAPTATGFAPLYLPDPEEIPAKALHGQPDEDFWQCGVAPVPPKFQPVYLPDVEDDPAGSLRAPCDEVFWANPTPPRGVTFGPLYLPDINDFPAGSLKGQPDEDFWVNWVRPTVTAFFPLYLTDLTDLPAATLHAPYSSFSMQWLGP